jgi:hypothetical protein
VANNQKIKLKKLPLLFEKTKYARNACFKIEIKTMGLNQLLE